MKCYNLGIANIGKILMISGLTIVSGPLAFYIISTFNNQLYTNYIFVPILIFILPICFFIIWLLSQKFKDVFKITSLGIESQTHGIVRWQDIEICSWETFRGSIGIYLKLKDKTRLNISVSTWKDYSKRYDYLRSFYNDIIQARQNLNDKDQFQIREEMISTIFTNTYVIIIVIALVTLILFNILN